MDGRRIGDDQPKESKQEDRSSKSANLCSQTPSDDDTKDNQHILQSPAMTPPVMKQEISTAGLSEMSTKDSGGHPDLKPAQHALLNTFKLHQEDRAFDDVQFSDGKASDKSLCEGSKFEMDVNEIDEETDTAASSDCCSDTFPENDIKLETGNLAFDEVQYPDGTTSYTHLCGGSQFKMEVDEMDEETDSAASGDDHSAACLEYDIKTEPRGLESGLGLEVDEESDSFDDDVGFEYADDISHTERVRNAKDPDWEPSMSKYYPSNHKRTRPKKVNPRETQQTEIQPKRKYGRKPKSEKKGYDPRYGPKLCSICGKKCASPFALELHFRIHTGECPFLCNTCGSKFRSRYALKMHMNTHLEYTHKCSECEKSFSDKHHLKYHQKCHALEKPHVCMECGKSFPYPNHLKRHKIIHSGDLPYKCDTCGKGFNQASNLTVHLRTHTGVVPFTCSVCGKGFKHAFTLRNHKKKHDVPN